MDTREKTVAIAAVLTAAMFSAAGLAEERQSVADNETSSGYQDYIDAVRAQRQAQMAERRQAMQEAAENRRQQGEARRRALNDRSRRHNPPLPPLGDETPGHWPDGAIPPFWDNAWYYRGY